MDGTRLNEGPPAGQRTGLIQVYTGNGKGKTTAALGLALRASGHGLRVKMIQFMKGDAGYGEIIAARAVPGLEIVQSGLPTFVDKNNPGADDIRLAAFGLKLAEEAMKDDTYDLLILDELNVALDFGLVSLEAVLDLLDRKPAALELVLTGRGAHPEVIARADLVSEVKEVKHPFQQGIPARDGIEH